MGKLPFPVVCECGFNTMDSKKAYNHAMEHEYDPDLDTIKHCMDCGSEFIPLSKGNSRCKDCTIESMADDRWKFANRVGHY